jgi:hypothetical protein
LKKAGETFEYLLRRCAACHLLHSQLSSGITNGESGHTSYPRIDKEIPKVFPSRVTILADASVGLESSNLYSEMPDAFSERARLSSEWKKPADDIVRVDGTGGVSRGE